MARDFYRGFAMRHPRMKVTRSKKWGVALLPLPATFDVYQSDHTSLRKRRRHAMKDGYSHAIVSPLAHVDEIVAINRSVPARQGHPMAEHYLDRDTVAKNAESITEMHGVFDREGQLRAYSVVRPIGDVAVISQILGHGDHLERGIMYLLMGEIVQTAIERRDSLGSSRWLMYDTFWGATKGLAFFKERAGFAPYTVDWVWVDRPVALGRVTSETRDTAT